MPYYTLLQHLICALMFSMMLTLDDISNLSLVYSELRDKPHPPIVLSLLTFQDSGPSCTIFLLVKSRF